MKHIINLAIYTLLLFGYTMTTAQVVDLGCQDDTDAFTGPDRKDFGFPDNLSEGFMLNFILPDAEDCKKIQTVNISLDVMSLDISGLDPACGPNDYYVNIYSGCGSFAPSSCDVDVFLVDEIFNSNIFALPTFYSYDCDDFDFQFGDALGVDIVPVINDGVPGCQSAVTDEEILIEYEFCVEVTLVDLDIDVPLDLGDDLTVCDGETINIDAGGAYDMYDWTPTGETTQAIDAGPGVYTLEVTDDQGCTDTDMIEVIPSIPDLNVTSSDPDFILCAGETLDLEAETNVSDIEWNTGATTAVITVGPGVYSVTVTDANLCTADIEVQIIESPEPTVTITADDDVICGNGTTMITATAGFDDYAWSTNEDTESIEVGPGTYSVTVTDGNGCMAENMITISSVPEPSVTITADPEVLCGDETTTLSATPGFFNYLWSNGMFGPDIEVEAGDYEVTVIDVNACTAIATIEITQVDPPNAGSDAEIDVCGDGTLYDLESELGTFDSGGDWNDPDGSGVDLDDPDAVSFTGVASGQYIFTYTVEGDDPCDDAVASITVNVSAASNPGTDNDMTVCSNETVDLEDLLGTFDTGGTWSDLDGSGVDLDDPTDVDFSSVDPGEYEFEYSFPGNAPCDDVAAIITITVEESAEAGQDNSISICGGSLFDLTTALSNDAQLGGEFMDDDGSGALNGNIFDSNGLEGSTFNFTYEVGDALSGCGMDEAIITVSVVSQVTAGLDVSGIEVCLEESLNLFDILDGGDLGGEFILVSTGGVISNIFNGQDNGIGQYQINYVVGDDVICPEDQAVIDLEVIPSPTLSFSLDSDIICESNCNILTLNYSGTPDFGYSFEVVDLDLGTSYSATGSGDQLMDSIFICNTGANYNFQNDTISLGSSLNWGIVLSEYSDAQCVVSPTPEVGDTLFFNTGLNAFATIDTTLCSGESIVINGQIYDANFTFSSDTLTSVIGCDSIIDVSVSFFDVSFSTIDDELCSGSSIFVNGQEYNETLPMGQETIINGSADGCDSLIIIDLTFVDGYDITIDTMFCPGDSIFIDGNWEFTPNTIVQNLISSQGCDSTVTINLSLFQESNGTLDDTLCEGDVVVVNGTTYSASMPTGIEVLEGLGLNGCDSIVVIDLDFNPSYDLMLDVTLCDGDSIFLDGVWQFTAGTIVEDLQTTLSCDSTVTTSIVIENCDLDIQLSAEPVSCFDNKDGKIIITNPTLISPLTISWVGTGTGDSGSQNVDAPSDEICLIDLAIDEYEVTITDMNGITFQQLIIVEGPDEALSVSIASINPISCSNGDDGAISAIIDGGTEPYMITWNEVNSTDVDLTELPEGTYTATVTDANGCIATNDILLFAPPPFSVSFTWQGTPCPSVANGFFVVDGVQGANGDVDILFDGNMIGVGDTVFNLAAGIYDYVVTDAAGCSVEITEEILGGDDPDLVDYPASFSLTLGDSIQIQGDQFETGLSFVWQSENPLSCFDCADPILIALTSETLLLEVTNADGCQELVEILLNVEVPDNTLVLPNIFSPNGDGVNDEFRITLPDGFQGSTVIVQIFDRWGNLMFDVEDNSDNNISWDGRFNGSILNSGVYTYYIQVQPLFGELITAQGSITILN